MSSTRTVSVIIPALNEEDNLAAAVATVQEAVGERFADYELLIFDDASTDRTGQIADELAAQNSRIRVVHNQRNLGLGCNYTRGAELARMEYVAWFPGDNEVPGQAVSAILDAIASAEIVVPYISNPHVRTWSRRLISAAFIKLLNVLFGLRLQYFNGPCVYSRSLLLSVPIKSSGFACFAAILIRLILSGHSYVEIPIPTGIRRHGQTKAFRIRNLASIFSTIAGLFWDVHIRDRRKYAGAGRASSCRLQSGAPIAGQKAMKLRVKIFADGANLEDMVRAYRSGMVRGFTTNPTLMRQSGISDYESFACKVLGEIPDLPLSFEVFSDELYEMAKQARKIAGWGRNVYVKIPVTNTRGEFTGPVIKTLSRDGIKLNITAMLTLDQVRWVSEALCETTPAIISMFAGRIADTGRDPVPIMQEALRILRVRPLAELLWASPREVLNIVQADAIGCHIITVTNDLLKKVSILGTGLADMSLQTVKMFYDDAAAAGFHL